MTLCLTWLITLEGERGAHFLLSFSISRQSLIFHVKLNNKFLCTNFQCLAFISNFNIIELSLPMTRKIVTLCRVKFMYIYSLYIFSGLKILRNHAWCQAQKSWKLIYLIQFFMYSSSRTTSQAQKFPLLCVFFQLICCSTKVEAIHSLFFLVKCLIYWDRYFSAGLHHCLCLNNSKNQKWML